MDNAFFPIEVCEDIIDNCYNVLHNWQGSSKDFKESYGTLRACALVCGAWFPRSRYNLLHEVRLGSFDHVDLLLRLLTRKPQLATLVTAIIIIATDYVPFARVPLPRLLPSCRRFVIVDIPSPLRWSWNKYPPGYSRSISDFRGLTELGLTVDGLSTPELFGIIWSLPLLTCLELANRSVTGCPRMVQFCGKLSEGFMAKCKMGSCRQLRRLTFKSTTNVRLLSLLLFLRGFGRC